MMLARLLVSLWLLAYGKFRIRGVGTLIRLLYPLLPGLKCYPLEVPGLGTVKLDFADGMAYSLLLRFKLHDLGTDAGLCRTIENFLPPGAVLWDVGVFAGYISAYFADPRFQLSSVEAFEPNPVSIAHLRSFLGSSSVVHLHEFALGSGEAEMELSVPRASFSMASLVQKSEQADIYKVPVIPGDVARGRFNIPPPTVIKIDVEGFEGEVLKGLADTIANKQPVIVFEHIFLSTAELGDLVPKTYELYFIGDDGRIYSGMESRDKGHDALLVPAANKLIARLNAAPAAGHGGHNTAGDSTQ